jgi:hypothetical protein
MHIINTSLQRGVMYDAKMQPLQRLLVRSRKPLKRLERHAGLEHFAKARC